MSRAEVIPDVNGRFQISVLNVTEEDIKLKKRFKIGAVQKSCIMCGKIDVVNRQTMNDLSMGDVDFSTKVNYGSQLNKVEKSQVECLVKEYNNIFATEPKSPKRTVLVEHRIETTDKLSKISTNSICVGERR